MVRQMVTSRKREGGIFRFVSEHGFEAWDVINALAQFIACFAFYPSQADWYESGCVIFFVCAAIGVFISGHGLLESFFETKRLNAKEEGEKQQEFFESCAFFFGNLCFAAGSILFLPEVKEHNERNDLTEGTACFLAGSILFCLASFINAVGMTEVGSLQSQTRDKKVALLALLLTGFGGVLFAVGSVLYFPDFDTHNISSCHGKQIETKWNLITGGTHFYVVGAGLFTFSAILSFIHGFMKQMNAKGASSEPKLVDEKSQEASASTLKVAAEVELVPEPDPEAKLLAQQAADRKAKILAQQEEIERLQAQVAAIEASQTK